MGEQDYREEFPRGKATNAARAKIMVKTKHFLPRVIERWARFWANLVILEALDDPQKFREYELSHLKKLKPFPYGLERDVLTALLYTDVVGFGRSIIE